MPSAYVSLNSFVLCAAAVLLLAQLCVEQDSKSDTTPVLYQVPAGALAALSLMQSGQDKTRQDGYIVPASLAD